MAVDNMLYCLNTDTADGAWYAEVYTSKEAVEQAILDFAQENNMESELKNIDCEDTIFSFENGMGFHVQKMDDESFERLQAYFTPSRPPKRVKKS